MRCNFIRTIFEAKAIKQGLALTNYEDISSLNFNSLFTDLLGTTISPETLRQKCIRSQGTVESRLSGDFMLLLRTVEANFFDAATV